jgi:hypothetical protein|tara:strand:- start:456 stop:1034 length:579 start_codon:yes stop_codon:yes gene_type:complete
MPYLLDRIRESLAKEGIEPRTATARDWLKAKIQNLSVDANTLMQDKDSLKDSTIIGKMYFYYYDPKTKEKLQYYDRFPLVIPVEEYKDGFLGLNLHYIHPKNRVILLDKLSETLSNNKYDEKTKFRVSYNFLKSASKAFEATPCIKRYLFNHVKSRFLQINADEWDIAALLPVEDFKGASMSQVYNDSRNKF